MCAVIAGGPVHGVDAWLFAALVAQSLSSPSIHTPAELRKPAHFPDSLRAVASRALSLQAASRPPLKTFLASPFFDVPLVRTVKFLNNIALQEPAACTKFFEVCRAATGVVSLVSTVI